MSTVLRSLVDETVELIGVDAPDVLSSDAPVLQARSSDEQSIYLVGLIGGKDVGKSSFVNAVVGRQITPETSHGKGTATVIAYAHESAAAELKPLLEADAPGRYRIVTHRNGALVRQVLLDLPDIDSVYDDHIELTRRMLRRLLHPVWIQSVEKYADQNPQKLLARVAEGNDPQNFVFCLNKIDQLGGGNSAAREICQDYARRVERLLKLPGPPAVHAISARQPDAFDFPVLRDHLSRQRSESEVRTSLQRASRRQDGTVLQWLSKQEIPRLAESLQRLADQTRDLVTTRIGAPLIERVIPAMMDDAGYRMSLVDSAASVRLSRWPVVNVLQGVLSPLTTIIRINAGAGASSLGFAPDGYFDPSEPTLASRVQATFAQLRQSSPRIASVYEHNRLWDALPAEAAAQRLSSRLAGVKRAQQEAIASRYSKPSLWAPARWLLTIGALLWFPIVQPVLSLVLERNLTLASVDALRLTVELLSSAYLLKSLSFLLIYFLCLWALLRWDTHRAVHSRIEQWKSPDARNASLSPVAQTIDWLDELSAPVTARHDRLRSLADRIEQAAASA